LLNRSFLKQEPNAPNIPIQAIGLSLYERLTTDSVEEAPGTEVKRLQWLDMNSSMANLVGKNVLIVDEVDDTRTTLAYAVKELEGDVEKARAQLPADSELKNKKTNFHIFVLHNKNKPKKGELDEDMTNNRYCAAVTTGDVWICYPWEAEDINEHDTLAKQHPIVDTKKPIIEESSTEAV
jgi:hypoxanthine phosphoribosyltransferase